jgi:hypothetical protein
MIQNTARSAPAAASFEWSEVMPLGNGRTEPTTLDRRPLDTAETLAAVVTTLSHKLASIEETMMETHRLLKQKAIDKEAYSTSELAEVMGVSRYTVQERWCNAGRIECEKDSETGKWRIPGHEYDRLVRGGKLRPRR